MSEFTPYIPQNIYERLSRLPNCKVNRKVNPQGERVRSTVRRPEATVPPYFRDRTVPFLSADMPEMAGATLKLQKCVLAAFPNTLGALKTEMKTTALRS
jgi:hypothetical protein